MAGERDADVTIGVPVYNGEDYLALALDSLLSQTYANVRVIISDNCSTDHTADICREYAARDRRVELLQQPENVGMLRNFNYLLERADTPFFLWASHDDLWSENYVERLRAALTDAPDAVLACGDVQEVNEEGEETVHRSQRGNTRSYNWRCTFAAPVGWRP
jgi:glycosyltransferase involved in cell wall biosynthesis